MYAFQAGRSGGATGIEGCRRILEGRHERELECGAPRGPGQSPGAPGQDERGALEGASKRRSGRSTSEIPEGA